MMKNDERYALELELMNKIEAHKKLSWRKFLYILELCALAENK